MHPYFTHPLVLFAWTGAWSTAVLFAWLTLSNSSNRRALGDGGLDVYTLFTGLSSLHALSVALSFVPTSAPIKAAIFQAMWVLGLASLSYWVRAIRRFCGSSSRTLSWLSRGLLVVSAGALLDLIQSPLSGTSWMYSSVGEPPASLALRAAGMFAPGSLFGATLGALGVSLLLAACAVLYRELIRTRSRDPFLYAGIAISGLCSCAEVVLATTNSRYNMPILFMANLIEGFRITWVTERRSTAELERIRQAKSQQAAVIERQLADLKAISRLAKVGENTARLTHDMRNPLTVALGSLDMLETELASAMTRPQQIERLLALARQSLEHVSGLATKVTSQAQPPTSEPPREVPLSSVVDDAWSLNPATVVRFINGVDPSLRALGRPTELTQVFVNLLSNAAQAQEATRNPWIRVESEASERTVRIRVSDGGKKPSDATIDRMFRTQFTTHADSGTGLGLTICKQIVTEHDGSIWVDRESRSTSIVVELPRLLAVAAQ